MLKFQLSGQHAHRKRCPFAILDTQRRGCFDPNRGSTTSAHFIGAPTAHPKRDEAMPVLAVVACTTESKDWFLVLVSRSHARGVTGVPPN